MADLVICVVFVKQIAAMADATEVLISAGCGNAAFLPQRAGLEASIYLDWMLTGDTELKAKRYVVANYRDQREWAKRAMPGSPEEAALVKKLQPFGIDIHANRPTLAQKAPDRVAEANAVLSQPEFAAIDQAFTEARKLKQDWDVEWYALDGLKSIRQVADKVGKLAEYDFIYSRGSEVTHTGTYTDHMLMSNTGMVRFKPIRHLEEVHQLVTLTASTCIETYRKILNRYRPAERPASNKNILQSGASLYSRCRRSATNDGWDALPEWTRIGTLSQLNPIPEARQECLAATEVECEPANDPEVDMLQMVYQKLSSIRSWLNQHAFVIVVLLSVTHMTLAYIHPRDSG